MAGRHSEIGPEPEKVADLHSSIFRASIRQDGFVSADAGYGGGKLTTPEMQFSGGRLELNCDGSAGDWPKVEIQDGEGRALPG